MLSVIPTTGSMRKRVTVQQRTSSQDSYGQMIPVWSTRHQRWASVEPLSGTELLTAQQMTPEVTHRVTMRYDSTLAKTDRIIIGARVLEIAAITNPDERSVETVCLCKERN